jgi:hypothetical protein
MEQKLFSFLNSLQWIEASELFRSPNESLADAPEIFFRRRSACNDPIDQRRHQGSSIRSLHDFLNACRSTLPIAAYAEGLPL